MLWPFSFFCEPNSYFQFMFETLNYLKLSLPFIFDHNCSECDQPAAALQPPPGLAKPSEKGGMKNQYLSTSENPNLIFLESL